MKKIMNPYRSGGRWLAGAVSGLLLLLLINFSIQWFRGYPWVIILLASFSYFLFLGVISKGTKVKILLFNSTAVFFALFLYESFLWLSHIASANGESEQTSGTYVEGGYFGPHPYLGFVINKDGVFTSKKVINDTVIYDVAYTIKNGFRYTPNSNEKSNDCALFFGCSFTIGEGVSDSSTLPFYFNQFANQQYRIINYGCHGYGPHQMLAYIENRVAKDLHECNKEKIAVYTFLPNAHVARAAGYNAYNRDSTEYEIINGSLTKTGTFRKVPKAVEDKLAKSFMYRKLVFERRPSHDDLIRTVEIIKQSKELLLKQGVSFYVFVRANIKAPAYNFESKDEYYYFMEEMKKNNIKMFFLSDAIPDYNEKRDSYSLPMDGHPTALANEKVAKYVYTQLNDSTSGK